MSDDVDDTGGPAFPVAHPGSIFRGMTLRDWFAGHAIAGILTQNIDLESADLESCARYAYKFADEMLAARNRTGGD